MSPNDSESEREILANANFEKEIAKEIRPWRGFLAVFIIAIFLLTAVQVSVSTSVSAATTNRVLTMGYAEFIDSANPWIGLYDISYIFYSYIYSYLMYPNEDGIQSPNLAKEWWYMNGTVAASLDQPTDFNNAADFPIHKNPADWPLGSIWEYNLTPNVYWNDGVPFTADDVEWSFEIQIGANFMIYWAYQPVTRWIDHVEKVDDYKVRFFFSTYENKTPIPIAWGNCLSVPVIPKHAFEGKPASYVAQEWDGYPAIGTGPLMGTSKLKDEITAKESVTLVRNRYYNFTDEDGVQKGLGAYYGRHMEIDTLIMKFFSEEQTQVSSVKTGAIDACEVTAANYLAMKNDPRLPETIQLVSIISPTVYTKISHWNVMEEGTPGALNPARLDPAIHRASALATNKTGILAGVFKNLGQIGYHLITPVWPQYYWEPGDDEISWFNVTTIEYNATTGKNETKILYSYHDTLRHVMDFNIQRANEILDAAGYVWDNTTTYHGKNVRKIGPLAAKRLVEMGYANDIASVLGKPLSFEDIIMQENFEDREISKVLQDDFAKIGIDLYEDLVNEATWNTEVYSYAFHFTETYWSGDVDPNYLLYVPTSYALWGWNEWGTNNKSYDYYYDMQARTLDPVERMHWIEEACKWTYLWSGMMVTVYPSICFALNNLRWTNWGNWTEHPGLAIDHFWGEAPYFFQIKWKGEPDVTGDITGLIIAGIVILALVAVIASVVLLRKRKEKRLLEEEEKEEPEEIKGEEKG
ncbi:MAG: ABC transporter substrate-binding protein [Thermoplasmata archaeon]